MNFAFVRELNRQINKEVNLNFNIHSTFTERDFVFDCKYGHLKNIIELLYNLSTNQREALIHCFHDKPVRTAAEYGHLEIVEYLIERGANIYADNNYAFEHATRGGHLKLIQYFVEEYGYDIDNDFYLNIVVDKGKIDVVRYLCSIRKKSINDDTIKLAARCGRINILKYFESMGYNINCGLSKSIEYRQVHVAKYILSKGAEINDHMVKLVAEREKYGYDGRIIYDYVMGLQRLTLRNRILMACFVEKKNTKLVRKLTQGIDGSNACIDNSIVFTFVEQYQCKQKQFPIAVYFIKNCGANLSMLSKRNIQCQRLKNYVKNRITKKAIRLLYTSIRNKYYIPIDVCKLIQSYV